jgi:hypothetical protein
MRRLDVNPKDVEHLSLTYDLAMAIEKQSQLALEEQLALTQFQLAIKKLGSTPNQHDLLDSTQKLLDTITALTAQVEQLRKEINLKRNRLQSIVGAYEQ